MRRRQWGPGATVLRRWRALLSAVALLPVLLLTLFLVPAARAQTSATGPTAATTTTRPAATVASPEQRSTLRRTHRLPRPVRADASARDESSRRPAYRAPDQAHHAQPGSGSGSAGLTAVPLLALLVTPVLPGRRAAGCLRRRRHVVRRPARLAGSTVPRGPPAAGRASPQPSPAA